MIINDEQGNIRLIRSAFRMPPGQLFSLTLHPGIKRCLNFFYIRQCTFSLKGGKVKGAAPALAQ